MALTQAQMIARLRQPNDALREGEAIALAEQLAAELLIAYPSLPYPIALSCACACVRRAAWLAAALDELQAGETNSEPHGGMLFPEQAWDRQGGISVRESTLGAWP
jgi:hypothetical protein